MNSETIGYRYNSIKIQPVIAIFEIPQGGEHVPLIIEGAGKRGSGGEENILILPVGM